MPTSTEPPYRWNVSSLSRKIQEEYRAHQHLASSWTSESPQVTARLKALESRMNRQYAEPSLLGVGGAGIVLKVTDKHLGDQPCAVKFPRPVSGQTDLLTRPTRQRDHTPCVPSTCFHRSYPQPRNSSRTNQTRISLPLLRDGFHRGTEFLAVS